MSRYDVLTLHPELVRGPLTGSILGRAQASELIQIGIHDIRDHASDRHRTVDDTPYGGGAGMVMKVDVVAAAIEAVRTPGAKVLLMAPHGTPFNQQRAQALSQETHLILLCGHYEGVDARIETLVDEVVSIGDFVLTGGEIAACAIVDAVARLRPGVLGNAASPRDESFSDGLLEYPQFTRPRSWNGSDVPEVLLSGHHARIEAWRIKQSKLRTRAVRPDLWAAWCAHQQHSVDDDALGE